MAASDPNRLSVVIALDCLKKLASRLPEYERALDVVVCVLESGLFVRARDVGLDATSAPPHTSGDHQLSRECYFEECQALERALEQAQALAAQTTESRRADAQLSVREQIDRLLPQLRADAPLETEGLFLALLRSNMELLACLACTEVLKHFFQQEAPATKKRFFYDVFLKAVDSSETQRLLREIAAARLSDFRAFVTENLDAMDAILMDAPLPLCCEDGMHTVAASGAAARRPAPTAGASQPLIFQRLIERHPSEFAAVLWHSPFLTAHIFQVSVRERVCVCVWRALIRTAINHAPSLSCHHATVVNRTRDRSSRGSSSRTSSSSRRCCASAATCCSRCSTTRSKTPLLCLKSSSRATRAHSPSC